MNFFVPNGALIVKAGFTSDGVGVGIVSGVVRALTTQRKSKIGIVSRFISAAESESKE